MKLFCENSQQLKVAYCLPKITSPWVFDWALNTPMEREMYMKQMKAFQKYQIMASDFVCKIAVT